MLSEKQFLRLVCWLGIICGLFLIPNIVPKPVIPIISLIGFIIEAYKTYRIRSTITYRHTQLTRLLIWIGITAVISILSFL